MAKTKKPRKPYRGRDAAVTPQVIKVQATERSTIGNWWQDHKQTVMIRAVQLGLLLILYVIVTFVWSLLT